MGCLYDIYIDILSKTALQTYILDFESHFLTMWTDFWTFRPLSQTILIEQLT